MSEHSFDQSVLDCLARDLEGEGLAILAGAGVSTAPPSCAPLFRPLRDGLLKSLSESLVGALDISVLERCSMLFRADSDVRRGVEPVPEVLFQALHAQLGTQLFDALRVLLELSAPNPHHRFVADLAGQGLRLLITTNFEDGFEQAFRAAGRSFELCADGASISRSLQSLDPQSTARAEVPIWKVHGTLDVGAEETIRVTLSQVARESLDPSKFEPVIAATARLPLLVVGYSGYDADLSRTLIQAGDNGRRLYWLAYRAPESQDPSLRILQAWQDRGHLLVGDLADLFSGLCGVANSRRTYTRPAGACDEALARRFVALDDWVAGIAIDDRLVALAVLCWKLTDYQAALDTLAVLEERAVHKKDGSRMLACLLLQTSVLRSAGREREIGLALSRLQALRESMGAVGDPEFFALDAMLLHEIGSYFHAQGERALAEDAFRKALALGERTGDPGLIATVSQSLGALLSHHRSPVEANKCFERALKLALAVGDRYAELKARHELGILAFERGDHASADSFLTENVRLAHELGTVDIEASGAYELGLIALRGEKNHDRAEGLFSKAHGLARLTGDRSTELRALLYLGDVQQERRHDAAAIETLTRCADGAAETGDGAIEATALTRRARSYALTGEFDRARADVTRARPLAERWHPALVAEVDALAAALARL